MLRTGAATQGARSCSHAELSPPGTCTRLCVFKALGRQWPLSGCVVPAAGQSPGHGQPAWHGLGPGSSTGHACPYHPEKADGAVCWGDAPEPTFQLLGGALNPFLFSRILLVHHSPFGCCSGPQHGICWRSLVLEHQHGPRLCVEGLAASLRESLLPAALNAYKSKTKLNRGWGTACALFPPSSLPGD